METTIKAAQIGARWAAFRETADLSEYDETKLHDWRFEGADCTTGSLIRASDGVTDFGLARDKSGFQDSAGYATAYDVSFGVVHLHSVTGPGVSLTSPTRAQVEGLPPTILREYVSRADASRGVTNADLDSLRKPKEATGKGEQDVPEKKELKAKA